VVGRIRRVALVALMVLAAVVAPIAVPIRMIVLQRRRVPTRTEFVVRDERRSETV
jgi:hypothetical protein